MHALRSYLKPICEYELHSLSDKKVSGAKGHGKNYINLGPTLVRHLLRNRLLHCRYGIPKINMLHNLSCCETRFILLCRWYLLFRSLNLTFRQCKLHNIFIFGMAFCEFEFHAGTLLGNFRHHRCWPYLDFLLEQQIKLVLRTKNSMSGWLWFLFRWCLWVVFEQVWKISYQRDNEKTKERQ